MVYKKNDILTVSIEDMGSDGEGIGKVDGYTLFVKDAIIGDVVDVMIMKAKKNYAYAKLRKVITYSEFRVKPRCAFSKECGGCQIQALNYEKQLEYKQSKIKNNLIRIGGFLVQEIEEKMESIVGMDTPFRYRNKAQYPVGTDKDGNLITGFYAGRTHSIIPNTDCLLGVEGNKLILETILEYMKEYQVNAYDEVSGNGLVRHILIRTGFTSGEVMVCFVINGVKRKSCFPAQEVLIKRLSDIPGMTSISISYNGEQTNVIMGTDVCTIWGSDTIRDVIHMRDVTKGFALTGKGVEFQISPLSFYQVNPVQTEKLYSVVLEYAGLTGKETVWDLYCGIGTISLFLADAAKQVYGVEVVAEAIVDAKRNAKENGIGNAEFFVGKAEVVLPEKYEEEGIYADVIVVDPPRKGCDVECLETMLRMEPEKIVYVSCDSATLARDLKVLCDGGKYGIERVRGVDLFGGTVHVECVIKMQYCGSDRKK